MIYIAASGLTGVVAVVDYYSQSILRAHLPGIRAISWPGRLLRIGRQWLTLLAPVRILKDDGWYEDRVAGSHHIFRHTTKSGHLAVPHPKKDLGIGLVNKVLKQAGLK